MLLADDAPYALHCADIRDIVDDRELIPDGSMDAVLAQPPLFDMTRWEQGELPAVGGT